jgi:hypothetical protein
VKSILEALRAVNEDARYPAADALNGRVNVLNEIAYADETGEMQFLRRTLLAGAYKFDRRHSQTLPEALLTQFKTNINFVTNLVCIGYGFGDSHINAVMREWLELSADRRLKIIDPFIKALPSSLLHLAPQIEIIRCGATDYFDSIAGITRTRKEKLEKRLHICARKLRTQRFREGLKAFDAEAFSDKVRDLAEQMKISSLTSIDKSGPALATFFAGFHEDDDDRLERIAKHLEALCAYPVQRRLKSRAR